MGRACKCVACGKDLTTDIAYAIKVGSRNQYYCSEEEHNDYLRLEEVFEYIMNYRSKNHTLAKYIKEWFGEPYVADVLDNHKDEIHDILSRKRFNSEYGLIQYLQAVIDNNLHDWTEEFEYELEASRTNRKCSDSDLYEIKGCPPRRMKCLDDFED